MKNKLIRMSLVFAVCFSCWTGGAIASACPDNPSQSSLYFFVRGRPQKIERLSLKSFKLDGDRFDGGKKLRFHGVVRKNRVDDDFPIVVKIRGMSERSTKMTDRVYVKRPKFKNGTSYQPGTTISLLDYSRYHFPRDNGYFSGGLLEAKSFHTSYRINGGTSRTDQTDEKRELFQFKDVPNTYVGSKISRGAKTLLSAFLPGNAKAATNNRIVYLHAEIQNLGDDSCFDFSTYIPSDIDDLYFTIEPIDPRQRTLFDESPFERNTSDK